MRKTCLIAINRKNEKLVDSDQSEENDEEQEETILWHKLKNVKAAEPGGLAQKNTPNHALKGLESQKWTEEWTEAYHIKTRGSVLSTMWMNT